MPANLSPEFKDAQQAFRRAKDPQERLERLREMLRTIPKHKGTEHIQADIKTRIRELTAEIQAPKRGGARGGAELTVRHEGAAQVALLGPPNSGKSSLHARLTGSHAVVGPYPFTTKLPLPGMLLHEDVQFQLVDLPPVSEEHVEPWMGGALQTADAALLVLDLSEPSCVDGLDLLRRALLERKVSLIAAPAAGDDEAEVELFRVALPTLLVASQADRLRDPEAELRAFLEITGVPFRAMTVSAETGHNLASVGPALFDLLGVVRAYSKVPGHPADTRRPFTLRSGDTVRDVARLVHRGMAGSLRFARIWGPSAGFDGQQVSGEHPVADRDVVELHW
jgi:hypothetical protein